MNISGIIHIIKYSNYIIILLCLSCISNIYYTKKINGTRRQINIFYLSELRE